MPPVGQACWWQCVLAIYSIMPARLKTAAPIEGVTIEIPPLDMVARVSGTGGFVADIDLLRKFNVNGVEPGELTAVIDALEEQEHLYAMAILDSEDTGIKNTMWYIPVPEGRHGPRIKVAIDPPHAKRPGEVEATVPFDAPAIGPIPAALEQQVRAFIELNRDALLWYWKLGEDISTKKFLARLHPISSK